MRMKSKKQEYIKIAMTAALVSFFLSREGIAAENNAVISATISGNDAVFTDVENKNSDVSSLDLPVIAEGKKSPFDFSLDPCGLVYETNALRYGGGAVEKGATLIFRNEEGEYDFSRNSDKLSIANRSGNPVIVTITASVSELDEIDLIGYDDFSGNENPAIYLAIIDGQENEQPISEEGDAVIRIELDSGVYSFGLTGACNPNADWQNVYVHPRIIVAWHVEPVLMGEEEIDRMAKDNSSENLMTETDIDAGIGSILE